MNIVIKLPNGLAERILAFPFLQAIQKQCFQKLDEDEVLNIHLISLKENIDVLYLLPFSAYYHELEPEDLKTIFSVHRGVAELKIEKPDIFISTTDSFVDASIGKNLKATKKVGFSSGKNNIFFTQKIEPNDEVHFSDKLHPLMKSVEPYPNKILTCYSRSLKPAYGDFGSYCVIDIAAIENLLEEHWVDFFELAKGRNFVLMSSELDEVEQKDQINKWIKKLPSHNEYKFFSYASNIEFARVVAYSSGFVTWSLGLSLLASYCGCHNILLAKKDSLETMGPRYFRGEVDLIQMSGRTPDDYSKVFDRLLQFL